MKNKIIMSLLIISLVLSGCGIYGGGETIGYVYAVDDGIVWDKVWYKSSLESSESDCYLIDDDYLKEELKKVSGKNKVKLKYRRHWITNAICDNLTSDEIIGFEVLE